MSRRARKYAQSRPWETPAEDAPPIDWDAVAQTREQEEQERTEE
jgi:hypothetical protein